MGTFGSKVSTAQKAMIARSAELFWREPDAMHAHALLINRADPLAGCTVNSPEEAELECVTAAIEAYEAKRWPSAKTAAGKG
jgi:hypothetical protein